MELNPENNTIPQEETSKVSSFINAEQGDSLKPSDTPDMNLVDSEQNNQSELSQPVNENEPKEQTYQDILGSGDLLKKIIKQGASDNRPMKGEQVLINLVGRLEGKDDVIEEEKNLEITLGDCEVIQGIDLALSLMNVGEIAELQIASRFGYGEKGLEPKIVGRAKLIYTVEMISAKPEILPDDLTPIERLKIGLKKKDKGNWWYARNENTMALHVYRKALQYFGGPGEIIGSDTEHDIQSERIKTLNNMAAVHMSMNSLDLALQTLDSVLTVEPVNEKAIMRKGKVLALKGQNVAAARELKKALQINPNNKTVQNILSNVEAALVKERVQERELYKKMLGQKETKEKTSTKDNQKSNTTFIISGLVAGLAVICGYCYLNNNFPFSKFSSF